MLPSRSDRILERVRAIPEGFVRTYGDIDPGAPRLVGLVLSQTHEDIPWQRVVRADGTLPKGAKQRALLLQEGIPMRGDRVDLKEARLPAEFETSWAGPTSRPALNVQRRRSSSKPSA